MSSHDRNVATNKLHNNKLDGGREAETDETLGKGRGGEEEHAEEKDSLIQEKEVNEIAEDEKVKEVGEASGKVVQEEISLKNQVDTIATAQCVLTEETGIRENAENAEGSGGDVVRKMVQKGEHIAKNPVLTGMTSDCHQVPNGDENRVDRATAAGDDSDSVDSLAVSTRHVRNVLLSSLYGFSGLDKFEDDEEEEEDETMANDVDNAPIILQECNNKVTAGDLTEQKTSSEKEQVDAANDNNQEQLECMSTATNYEPAENDSIYCSSIHSRRNHTNVVLSSLFGVPDGYDDDDDDDDFEAFEGDKNATISSEIVGIAPADASPEEPAKNGTAATITSAPVSASRSRNDIDDDEEFENDQNVMISSDFVQSPVVLAASSPENQQAKTNTVETIASAPVPATDIAIRSIHNRNDIDDDGFDNGKDAVVESEIGEAPSPENEQAPKNDTAETIASAVHSPNGNNNNWRIDNDNNSMVSSEIVSSPGKPQANAKNDTVESNAFPPESDADSGIDIGLTQSRNDNDDGFDKNSNVEVGTEIVATPVESVSSPEKGSDKKDTDIEMIVASPVSAPNSEIDASSIHSRKDVARKALLSGLFGQHNSFALEDNDNSDALSTGGEVVLSPIIAVSSPGNGRANNGARETSASPPESQIAVSVSC